MIRSRLVYGKALHVRKQLPTACRSATGTLEAIAEDFRHDPRTKGAKQNIHVQDAFDSWAISAPSYIYRTSALSA